MRVVFSVDLFVGVSGTVNGLSIATGEASKVVVAIVCQCSLRLSSDNSAVSISNVSVSKLVRCVKNTRVLSRLGHSVGKTCQEKVLNALRSVCILTKAE